MKKKSVNKRLQTKDYQEFMSAIANRQKELGLSCKDMGANTYHFYGSVKFAKYEMKNPRISELFHVCRALGLKISIEAENVLEKEILEDINAIFVKRKIYPQYHILIPNDKPMNFKIAALDDFLAHNSIHRFVYVLCGDLEKLGILPHKNEKFSQANIHKRVIESLKNNEKNTFFPVEKRLLIGNERVLNNVKNYLSVS